MIERNETPTPGVNIQDVEHDARPETRVDNAGVRVKPPRRKPVPDRADEEAELARGVVALPPD